LGGAIFNGGGTVTVRNSTFTRNFAVRGLPGGDNARRGADAGGAIFSLQGFLTVENTTISGNETTGGFGGILFDNRELAECDPGLVGACINEVGFFTLRNTIVAHNGVGFAGPDECAEISPAESGFESAGNLITQNSGTSPCSGVVSSDDPQLGPLQKNGGLTPTMAIASLQGSPAQNAADATTSLATDQRGLERPQMGGFDIGAFELCVNHLQQPCVISAGALDTTPLTVAASSMGSGTTTPAPGDYAIESDSVVLLTAVPSANHCFVSWNGDVTIPTSATTTVILNRPQAVTANFASVVTTAIARPMLYPPNHNLVNVGLTATENCNQPASFQVQVLSNEGDQAATDNHEAGLSPDAASIGVNTLKLRAERAGDGDGRVYLIVVRASDSAGNTGFSCGTAVVPHDSSAASVRSVNNRAAVARAYCDSTGASPPGYIAVGNGPIIGPKNK
jgi:hypothetical protein